ncbi:MAG TPA: MBL fold metallo-hydrolase [Candidatus Acidoferrum sp.]|nr:MBL fold metallo-hydrolase [Candidatus Acidoferrum sp.]
MNRLAAITTLTLLCCAPCLAQPQIDYAKLDIKTTDLGHNLYLLNWQGGDSLFLVGDDGVLLVDTAVPQLGDKIKAAIAHVSAKPIRYVINTHAHADHFGSNELMAKGGAIIIGHDLLRERMVKGQYLASFNQTIPPSPPAAVPTITYTDTMTIHFGGETVELIHVPAAHMDNDTLVHFKRANVIHASGTVGDRGYPFFDMSGGGSLAGTIAAEDKMLALADDNTRIIPDEGDPANKKFLQASRDALAAIKTRVQKLIDEGKDEAQTLAAKPSKDIDARLVPQGGFLSGDTITRMAYQSLKGIKPPARPQ